MHGKEFLINLITTYFALVTLITIAILILGSYFAPEASFGYIAFASPLIYGACGVIPTAVMYSKRELTMKEIVIRKIIQFFLVEGIVLAVTFQSLDIHTEQRKVLISMAICVFIIFILAHIISWIQNYMSARQMTKELILFQQNVK